MVTPKLCKYAEICSMFSEVKKLCTHNVWQASILKILPGPERPAALCFDNNENRNNVLPRSGPRGRGRGYTNNTVLVYCSLHYNVYHNTVLCWIFQ